MENKELTQLKKLKDRIILELKEMFIMNLVMG